MHSGQSDRPTEPAVQQGRTFAAVHVGPFDSNATWSELLKFVQRQAGGLVGAVATGTNRRERCRLFGRVFRTAIRWRMLHAGARIHPKH